SCSCIDVIHCLTGITHSPPPPQARPIPPPLLTTRDAQQTWNGF
ncbi:hypothetical protein L195_g029144, partial [Trifolium pratense]